MIPGISNSGYRANTVVPGSSSASISRTSAPTGFAETGSSAVTNQALAYGNGEYVVAGVSAIHVRSGESGSWTTVPIPSLHNVLGSLYAEQNGVKYWMVFGLANASTSKAHISYFAINRSLTEVTTATQWNTSAQIDLGNQQYNCSGSLWIPGHAVNPFLFVLGNKNALALHTTSITGNTWTTTSIQAGTAVFVRLLPVQMSGVVTDRIVIGSTSSAVSLWVSSSDLNVTSGGSSLGSGSPIGTSVPMDVIQYGNIWIVICQNSNIGMVNTGGNFTTAGSWTATTVFPTGYSGRHITCRNGNVVATSTVATSDKYIVRKDISAGFSGGWTQSLVSTSTEGSRRGVHDQFLPHVWLNALGMLEYSW